MIPQPQYTNYLMSSALLWLDNLILTKSRAFANTPTTFYRTTQVFNGCNTYSTPFGQFIADSSISGANIITGVYINGNVYGTGQGGLVNIDYNNGRIYTSGLTNPTITGTIGIKYFNVKMTSESEEKILTETAYSLRPRTSITPTGLDINQINYPIIYLKNNGGFNDPLAFGGLDKTMDNLRIIIITDSDYSLKAIESILRDTRKTHIPLFTSDQMPFNIMGDLRTGYYDYNSLKQSTIDQNNMLFIQDAYINKYNENSYIEIRRLNPQIHWSIIDLVVEAYRYPRL